MASVIAGCMKNGDDQNVGLELGMTRADIQGLDASRVSLFGTGKIRSGYSLENVTVDDDLFNVTFKLNGSHFPHPDDELVGFELIGRSARKRDKIGEK